MNKLEERVINNPFLFEFLVDEDINFLFWIKYTKKNKEDSEIIQNFFSSKEDSWIWDRYNKKEIENEQEEKELFFLKQKFSKDFDDVWKDISHKLIFWQKELEKIDFHLFFEPYKKAENFLKVDKSIFGKKIKVFLCIQDKDYPRGIVFKKYPDELIVSLSEISIEEKWKIVGIIFHELFHKSQDNSIFFQNIIKTSYQEIIEPLHLKIEGPNWKFRFLETVAYAFSGQHANSFMGALFPFDKNQKIKDIHNIDKYEDKHSLIWAFRKTGEDIRPKLEEYINQNKEVDKEFGNLIAKSWEEIKTLVR